MVFDGTDNAQRAIDHCCGLSGQNSERYVGNLQGRSRRGGAMKHITRKAALQVNQNEGLIFEKSSAGKARLQTAFRSMCRGRHRKAAWIIRKKDLGNMPR